MDSLIKQFPKYLNSFKSMLQLLKNCGTPGTIIFLLYIGYKIYDSSQKWGIIFICVAASLAVLRGAWQFFQEILDYRGKIEKELRDEFKTTLKDITKELKNHTKTIGENTNAINQLQNRPVMQPIPSNANHETIGAATTANIGFTEQS